MTVAHLRALIDATTLTATDVLPDARALVAGGVNADDIAARLGVTRGALCKAFERRGEQKMAGHFDIPDSVKKQKREAA